MALLLVIIAGLSAAISNLFMRRSLDQGGSVGTFLLIQMSVACAAAALLGPLRTGQMEIPLSIAALGLGAGLILGLMLYLLGQALAHGPAGLTFAALNSATVMPAILMALFFGATFGYAYKVWHALGSLIVVAGLFWAGRGETALQRKWITVTMLMFACHIALLVIFQWRALLLNLPHPEEMVSFFTSEALQSQWFMPFYYLGAAMFQLPQYLRFERRIPAFAQVRGGVYGGVANMLCTLFLIWGTEVASGLENAVIYPLFSIVGIVACNAWGQWLYQEKVNWRACQVCAAGLVIGTVDWAGVLNFF